MLLTSVLSVRNELNVIITDQHKTYAMRFIWLVNAGKMPDAYLDEWYFSKCYMQI